MFQGALWQKSRAINNIYIYIFINTIKIRFQFIDFIENQNPEQYDLCVLKLRIYLSENELDKTMALAMEHGFHPEWLESGNKGPKRLTSGFCFAN